MSESEIEELDSVTAHDMYELSKVYYQKRILSEYRFIKKSIVERAYEGNFYYSMKSPSKPIVDKLIKDGFEIDGYTVSWCKGGK